LLGTLVFVIFKKHYFFSLKFSKIFFYFIFCILIRIANTNIINSKNFIIKIFWKFYCCLLTQKIFFPLFQNGNLPQIQTIDLIITFVIEHLVSQIYHLCFLAFINSFLLFESFLWVQIQRKIQMFHFHFQKLVHPLYLYFLSNLFYHHDISFHYSKNHGQKNVSQLDSLSRPLINFLKLPLCIYN